jgi:surface-anchored protein
MRIFFDALGRLLWRGESGAEATAVQTLARSSGDPRCREASGLWRVHRRFGMWFSVFIALVTLTAPAQVVYLDHQHMDFQLQYYPAATGSNQLDIVLGYDAGTDHFTVINDQVYIVGNTNAQLTIPSNPNFAFLGSPGAPIWILPQSQNVTLPYLGTSAEDLPLGIFDGPLRFELVSVEGPGNFFAWANSGAGQPPIVKFICTNGVVSTQYNVMTPLTGSHEHYNWGFSANGLYRVTFRTVGQRVGESTNLIGKEVAFAFQILPLRPWEYWVSTNWLPATARKIASASADPDGDKIVNVLEYAFGNDPNIALYTNAPAVTFVTDSGTNYGALRYVHATNATDLTFDVRAASVLGGTCESITNITGVVSAGARQYVTVRDSISQALTTNRFYQLRVKLNYP